MRWRCVCCIPLSPSHLQIQMSYEHRSCRVWAAGPVPLQIHSQRHFLTIYFQLQCAQRHHCDKPRSSKVPDSYRGWRQYQQRTVWLNGRALEWLAYLLTWSHLAHLGVQHHTQDPCGDHITSSPLQFLPPQMLLRLKLISDPLKPQTLLHKTWRSVLWW